jgi:ABC-type transporter Mla subunit MlaD
MYLITENNALAEEVIGKISEVLGRAHRTAATANEPGEARAILHVAQAFADELAGARSDFDRVRFIREITDDRLMVHERSSAHPASPGADG